MQLEAATLESLRSNWPTFEEYMNQVIRKCKLDFIPADVYRAVIMNGGPVVFWIKENMTIVGATVVTRHREIYSNKEILSLDLTCIDDSVSRVVDFRDCIEQLAKEQEVDRIEWHSPRGGWNRVFDSLGYKQGSVCYYREVSNG